MKRFFGQFSESPGPTCGLVNNRRSVGTELRYVGSGPLRGRADQHCPCGGAGLPHRLKERVGGSTAAGEHDAAIEVGTDELGPALRSNPETRPIPIGAEFLGKYLGESRGDALSHLGLSDEDLYMVVWRDREERADAYAMLRCVFAGSRSESRRPQSEAESQTRASCSFQKMPPVKFGRFSKSDVHSRLPVQVSSGGLDRHAYAVIGHTAAKIPGHGSIDVFIGWFVDFLHQRDGGHDLARLTVSALRYL